MHDCMHRVRYKYHLCFPLSKRFLSYFQKNNREYETQITDLTHVLPDSRIIFSINARNGDFMITGSIGLHYVNVTYFKEQRRREREKFLEKLMAST